MAPVMERAGSSVRAGVDLEGVEEGDLTGGGDVVEEGADVKVEGEAAARGGGIEGGDGPGEVEEVSDILREGEEAEGRLIDGEGGTDGLDVATALHPREVGGHLLLRHRLRWTGPTTTPLPLDQEGQNGARDQGQEMGEWWDGLQDLMALDIRELWNDIEPSLGDGGVREGEDKVLDGGWRAGFTF